MASISVTEWAEAAAVERPAAQRRRGRTWLARRLLVVADGVGVLAACILTTSVAHSAGRLDVVSFGDNVLLLLVLLPVWVVVAACHGLYRRDRERASHATADELLAVTSSVAACSWVFLGAGVLLTGVGGLTARFLLALVVIFGVSCVTLVLTARALARALGRHHTAFVQNVLIAGAGDVGQLIARKLRQHPEYGLRLVGFVDAAPKPLRPDVNDVPLYLSADALPRLVDELDVDRVIVAFSNDPHDAVLERIREVRSRDVQIDIVPRLFDAVGTSVVVHRVEGLPLVGVRTERGTAAARVAKRLLDVAVAALGLALAAPFFAYAAWRIKRESPGPVFFRQTRLGLGMRDFTMLKFRTMKVGTDERVHEEYVRGLMNVHALPNGNGIYKLDRRDAVTPFGSFLRKTSLDELPQLINVLRGEMSLVGPRPCIRYETENYDEHHFDRFSVPAGITGLWQVTARARATFAEALDMDASYARGWSFWLDLSLLLRTPAQMFRTKGTA